jgi:hypothetical protein
MDVATAKIGADHRHQRGAGLEALRQWNLLDAEWFAVCVQQCGPRLGWQRLYHLTLL